MTPKRCRDDLKFISKYRYSEEILEIEDSISEKFRFELHQFRSLATKQYQQNAISHKLKAYNRINRKQLLIKWAFHSIDFSCFLVYFFGLMRYYPWSNVIELIGICGSRRASFKNRKNRKENSLLFLKVLRKKIWWNEEEKIKMKRIEVRIEITELVTATTSQRRKAK